MEASTLFRESVTLEKLPFYIRRPPNDLYINDSHVLSHHAKLFQAGTGYYLVYLGGETHETSMARS